MHAGFDQCQQNELLEGFIYLKRETCMLFIIKNALKENSNQSKLDSLSKFLKCNFKRIKRRRKAEFFFRFL